MRELGLDAFRFSIAWPRILPEGRGSVNAAGARLLRPARRRAARERHRAVPDALPLGPAAGARGRGRLAGARDRRGFVEYAEVVAERLGDRITHWVTHNEPWVVAWLGYGWGEHAPGRTSEADAIAAAHHLLLSHGWAVEVLRRAAPGAEVGIVAQPRRTSIRPPTRRRTSTRPRAARRHANRWFLDPLFRGEYPADMDYEPPVQAGDLEAIATPIDFLGVNNYFRFVVAGERQRRLARTSSTYPDAPYTDMGWEVYPDGLHELLVRVARDYAPRAIYVTENGAAFGDVRGHDGSVHDPERTAYLERPHRRRRAARSADGAPVKGYFVWSLPRQLRVEPRLLQAVRDRLRRLPDARAGAEGQLLLVPRPHRSRKRRSHGALGLMLYTVRDECAATSRGRCARSRRSATRASSSSTCTATRPPRCARGSTSSGSSPRAATRGSTRSRRSLPALAAELADARLPTGSSLSWIDPPASERRRAGARRADRRRRAQRVSEHGLRFGFHNHWSRARALDGGHVARQAAARCRRAALARARPRLGVGGRRRPGRRSSSARAAAARSCTSRTFAPRGTRAYCPVGDGAVGYDARAAGGASRAGAEWLARRAGRDRGLRRSPRSSARSARCSGSCEVAA